MRPSNRNNQSREPVTNVGNPPEELYGRNAIVGGCKIIYIEIKSFVRSTGIRVKQCKETKYSEAVLHKPMQHNSEEDKRLLGVSVIIRA